MQDRAKLEQQMPEFLRSIAVGLRTGLSQLQAIQGACQDFPDPIATLFQNVLTRMQGGQSFNDAVGELLDDAPSEEMTLFVTAMQVHAIAGGSLAEILDNVANTVHERLQLRGEVAALTAEGRWIIYILAGLVFLALGLGLYMARDWLNFGPEGVLGAKLFITYMVIGGLLALGAVWSAWIINVKH